MTTRNYFAHSHSIVESDVQIGDRTRIWAFAHILPGAVIGTDCNICDGVFIEGKVQVGNHVTVKCGVQLWDGVTLEDNVFIGPNVTFSNDNFPRSQQHLTEPERTLVRKGASIGANATILPGLVIGANAMVGAGSIVTRDVPPNAIVVGNPARITGYVSAIESKALPSRKGDSTVQFSIEQVRLIRLPHVVDLRGSLTFGEFDQHLPFLPKRYFVIFDVPTQEVRGEHAHKALHQFLVCLKGSCAVVMDDGKNRDEVVLKEPNVGLYLPPMVWATQYKYSPDTVLLVLASDVYDADDYIRNYDEFLGLVQQGAL